MHVSRLSLVDFRSYREVEIDLTPGPVTFIGANGQGKTNLVEAIDYLARLDSHRVSSDAPLVRHGAEQAYVRAHVQRADRQALIEVEINPGRSNRVRVNANPLPRARDLIGTVRTVIFSPEDLALVKGDPGERRRFLDHLVTMQSPRLAGTRSDVDRILKQRNALLKSSRGRADIDMSTLAVWNEHLARAGGELIAARLALLDDLAPHLIEAHARVAAHAAENRQQVLATYRSGTEGVAELRDPQDIAARLLEAMAERRSDELMRGVSLVGPHRDDVTLTIGELPAKGYASHGETWSLALALRLASHELLRADGDDPILILDDVFAELDEARCEQLAALVADTEQVLVTAAVAHDVPQSLAGLTLTVHDGTVSARD